MSLPEGLTAGLRGLCLAGRRNRSLATRHRSRGDRFGRRNNDDVLVIAQTPGWGGTGGGPAFGREVAHLALDDSRVVPAPAALGGFGDELHQDPLIHALALPRGKRRRGREDDAGPPAPCGVTTACPGRTRPGFLETQSALLPS